MSELCGLCVWSSKKEKRELSNAETTSCWCGGSWTTVTHLTKIRSFWFEEIENWLAFSLLFIILRGPSERPSSREVTAPFSFNLVILPHLKGSGTRLTLTLTYRELTK